LLFEFLLTIVVLAIVGFYVGIAILIHRENPKVAAFLSTRPVLAWPITLVTVGVASYITLGILFYIATIVFMLALGRGQSPVQ